MNTFANMIVRSIAAALFLLVCGIFTTAQAACGCVAVPSSSLSLTHSATSWSQTIQSGGTLTVYPPQQSGQLNIGGDPHPFMASTTGPWAATLRYRLNGTAPFASYPYNGNWSSSDATISASALTLGTNTMTVEAKCTSSGNTCVIGTFTVIRYVNPGIGAVTLTPACCANSFGNTGSIKLQMSGSVTPAGTGFLKVDKFNPGTSTWTQTGALMPFINGGSTACYPKTAMSALTYRGTLVDAYGNATPNNSGTPMPKQFVNCLSCCPTPPR